MNREDVYDVVILAMKNYEAFCSASDLSDYIFNKLEEEKNNIGDLQDE